MHPSLALDRPHGRLRARGAGAYPSRDRIDRLELVDGRVAFGVQCHAIRCISIPERRRNEAVHELADRRGRQDNSGEVAPSPRSFDERYLRRQRFSGRGSVRVAGAYRSRLSHVLRQARRLGRNPALRRNEEISVAGYRAREGTLGELEAEAEMRKRITGAVSHREREIAELRANRPLAVEYLKAAMESLDDPNEQRWRLARAAHRRRSVRRSGRDRSGSADRREALYRGLHRTATRRCAFFSRC